MAAIDLEGVEKVYPNGHAAVRGVDLRIADGELLVLVGPSGCGKSTTLRLVAGLETATAGRIRIGERDVTEVRVQERDVAMVFQSYALYPHKTVRQNLSFALEVRRLARAEIDRRVGEVARALAFEALLERKPAQLSGGQRQRVALGRAIVREPQAFLFDEPLSNLDATLRVQTRAELARLHKRLAATMVYVTHDQEEAMTLGDRIAVLDDGRIQQCAAPMEVYRRPANVFVAGFVGSPAMNLFECRSEAGRVVSPFFTLDLPGAAPPGALRLGIRPHDLELTAPGSGEVTARVDVVEPLGAQVLAHLELTAGGAAQTVRLLCDPERGLEEDTTVGLRLPRQHLHVFDAASGTRLPSG